MKVKVVGCLFIMILFNVFVAAGREVILLDKNWKFINRDIADAEKLTTNDANWEHVTIPHDWAICKPFDMNIDAQFVQVKEDGDVKPLLRTGRTGSLPAFGIGWYRKELELTKADEGKRIFVEFDGAMSLAKVYLNGEFIGEWPYGYSSFSFDLTDKVRFGERNVLAVRLENKEESSRWYSGAGIYRNVRLLKVDQIYIPQWGTQITTPEITEAKAKIIIRTKIANKIAQKTTLSLLTTILDENNKKIVSSSSTKRIDRDSILTQELAISKPNLWSVEKPTLYKVISQVFSGKELLDIYETSFGIRQLRFDANSGFYLNGKNVKLKGVCMHHDLGPLGAAINYRALQRQLEILKEMGCNAIRTSHNPPTPELLELTDQMGFLVMVEAFDEWKYGKNANGYHNYFDEWAEKDICNMIRRDRNHPSVIMWSIGNEISEQQMASGKEIARKLTVICHREDPTRLVTAGLNNHNDAIRTGFADELDIVGFNYKPTDYLAKHKKYPNYLLLGSETASTISSRGEYKFPATECKSPWYNDYQVSSYDLEYPSWATTPDKEFQAQDDNSFMMGEFVWTGFDYLGEPTPYNEGTPARSSYFGIVDLAGLKKDRFYLYQSRWSDKPVLHVLPHWNWPERIGKEVPVFCYTNYPKAELFVNGISQGIKEKNKESNLTRYRLMWPNVIYQPGEIKVVAYDASGKIANEQVVRTTGKPAAYKLSPDRRTINVGGKDLSFVTIETVDRDGNICPDNNQLVFCKVDGNGFLKALCNGDATEQTSFASKYMTLYNGKLVATIVSGDISGEIKLTVSGGKLPIQTLKLETK